MKRDPTIQKYLAKRNLKAVEEYDFKALRGKPLSGKAPAPVVRIVQTSVKPVRVEPEPSPLDTWMR